MSRPDPTSAGTTVALTGGSGFLGSYLRTLLAHHRVLLIGRKPLRLAANESGQTADLAAGPFTLDLPSGSVFCHAAHSATQGARSLELTRHAVAAVNACPAVERVVLVSTVSVYGDLTGGVISEAAPCRPTSGYGRAKLASELIWQRDLRPDCPLVVLRPTVLVGPDSGGVPSLIGDALRRPAVAMVRKSLRARASVHFVSVRTVAEAVAFALRTPLSASRLIMNVGDDEAPENHDYRVMQDTVRCLAALRPLPALPVPRVLVGAVGARAGRPNLTVHRVFSSRALADAGFVPSTSLRDELTRIVAWLTPTRPGAVAPGPQPPWPPPDAASGVVARFGGDVGEVGPCAC